MATSVSEREFKGGEQRFGFLKSACALVAIEAR
jgi:hypothetical protein